MAGIVIRELPDLDEDEPIVQRAIIYTRVSMDKKEGRSVAEQEEECRRFCERMGWPVYFRVFQDNSVGASRHSKGVRKDFQELMDTLQSGDVLVAWSDNRLHRNLETFVEIRKLCAKKKIPLAYSGQILKLWKSRDRAWAAQDATRAEAYSDDMREAQARALRSNARNGLPHGKPPFGYTVERHPRTGRSLGWVIVPEEAAIVREMYADYLSGMTLGRIEIKLREKGVLGREGVPYSAMAVRRTLLNPAYAGYRTYHGQIVAKAVWEPIVDEETYTRACKLLQDPIRRKAADTKAKYLLSGIATCGVLNEDGTRCGNPLGFSPAPNQGSRYACITTPTDGPKKTRTHLSRMTQYVDPYVEEELVTAVSDKEFAEAVLTGLRTTEGEYDQLIAKARELEEYVKSYRTAALDPANRISPQFMSDLEHKTGPEIKDLYAKANRVRYVGDNPLVEFATAEDPRKYWEALDLSAKRDIIRTNLNVVVLPMGRGNLRRRAHEFIEVSWKDPIAN